MSITRRSTTLEQLLAEARIAIESGQATKGEWPPMKHANATWWGRGEGIHETRTGTGETKTALTSQFFKRGADGEKTLVSIPKLSVSGSVDDFLSTSGPVVRKDLENDETLSKLKREKKMLQRAEHHQPLPVHSDARAKIKTNNNSRNHDKALQFDENLLKQAFSYGVAADRISLSSSSSSSSSATGLSNIETRNTSIVQVRKRRKNRGRKSKRADIASDKTNCTPNGNEQRVETNLDVETMVKNFQEGIRLKKLRQQLEKSKQSFHASEDFIRTATRNWFH